MTESDKIKLMTGEELKSNIITCDYKGKDFKIEVLDEILRRAHEKWYKDWMNS